TVILARARTPHQRRTLPTAIACAGFRAADVRRLFRKFRLFEVQRRPSECSKHRCFRVAGGLGFEPRLTESESAVLPLNYPPIGKTANFECSFRGASCRLVPCLLVGSVLERRRDASTSRTSRSAFQARKVRPLRGNERHTVPCDRRTVSPRLPFLAADAHAVRRPDMPKATVAIATSAQAATERHTPTG